MCVGGGGERFYFMLSICVAQVAMDIEDALLAG